MLTLNFPLIFTPHIGISAPLPTIHYLPPQITHTMLPSCCFDQACMNKENLLCC